jgi:bacillithiol biosynthesis cysteine-adding enzyme BshC
MPDVKHYQNMNPDCYPISTLPHTSKLFLDFVEQPKVLEPFYVAGAYSEAWSWGAIDAGKRAVIADLLAEQNRGLGASEQVMANIERLRDGASVVVTGQQVLLFGGPLLTLLKAATAIRKAQDATEAGHPQVPVFWLASEDHDLAEADHVVLPSRHELHTIRWEGAAAGSSHGVPAGGVLLGESIDVLLDETEGLLGAGPWMDDLRRCYGGGDGTGLPSTRTFAGAFARWISGVFAAHGLIVIDAASRAFHALGAETLRKAITDADDLNDKLLARDAELATAGYHSQVLVSPEASLLFLLDAETGARQPLHRSKSASDGPKIWQAGKRTYGADDLLAILDSEPERISPNALLRPVFQDTILPTASYVGGPAEVAYFAQSQVLYEAILGRTTPIFPRLSATLIEAPIAEIMSRHEITLADIFKWPADELAQRIGARSMPIEGKRKLAAAGNTLDEELTALTAWMDALNPDLGRSAKVAASKMRYQMNRLRRLAANFQLQQDASLRRHVDAIYLALLPQRHPQERVIGGAWFLSRYGDRLPALLVEHASQQCPGHKVIYL